MVPPSLRHWSYHIPAPSHRSQCLLIGLSYNKSLTVLKDWVSEDRENWVTDMYEWHWHSYIPFWQLRLYVVHSTLCPSRRPLLHRATGKSGMVSFLQQITKNFFTKLNIYEIKIISQLSYCSNCIYKKKSNLCYDHIKVKVMLTQYFWTEFRSIERTGTIYQWVRFRVAGLEFL